MYIHSHVRMYFQIIDSDSAQHEVSVDKYRKQKDDTIIGMCIVLNKA